MIFARSPRFEAYVAPARSRPALWRLLCGAILAIALWIAVAVPLLLAGPRLGVGPGGGLLLYLASFAGLVLGTGLAVRLFHRRPARSLLGPGGFRPRAFAVGVAAVAAIALVSTAATVLLAPPVRIAGFGAWTRMLPLALVLVLVQTAAEELLFRGYLTQALAARFRSPFFWAVLPALGFGLLHWDGAGYGRDAWLAVAAATAVGLAFSDVTARTGNLSTAIGLHFANNVVALLVIAMPGPTAALALFEAPVDAAHPLRAWLLADIATTLAAWGAWRLALAYRARAGRLHSRDHGSI